MIPFTAYAKVERPVYIRLMLLIFYKSFVFKVYIVAVIMQVILLLQSLHITDGTGFLKPAIYKLTVCVVLLPLILVVLLAYRYYNGSSFIRHALVYEFYEEGVTISGGPMLEMRIGWNNIVKKQALGGYVVLYLGRAFLAIPLGQFTDIQLGYIRDKVPKGLI